MRWNIVLSEYNRHFCVCNTNCSSFFLFVGKTGNTHTHDVARRRTNTLPVEIRRRIDARYCVPSDCSLPVSFKTFRCAGSNDSSPLVPLVGRQIPSALTIHHTSLEIQVDPLESSASTRPCTVARSLWWEGAANYCPSSPLRQKSVFFLFTDGVP
jgi:hypothetical protein